MKDQAQLNILTKVPTEEYNSFQTVFTATLSPQENPYGIIYMVINKVTGKIYIGQTTRSLEARIREHFYSARKDNKPNKFLNSIRYHGVSAFEYHEISRCPDKQSLDKAEIYFIKLFNSYDDGYNSTPGGSKCPLRGEKEIIALRATINEKTGLPCGISYLPHHNRWRFRVTIDHKVCSSLHKTLEDAIKAKSIFDKYGVFSRVIRPAHHIFKNSKNSFRVMQVFGGKSVCFTNKLKTLKEAINLRDWIERNFNKVAKLVAKGIPSKEILKSYNQKTVWQDSKIHSVNSKETISGNYRRFQTTNSLQN